MHVKSGGVIHVCTVKFALLAGPRTSTGSSNGMHTHTVPRVACMHGQLSSSRRWRAQPTVCTIPERQNRARRQLRCRAELAEAVEVSTPPEAQTEERGDPTQPHRLTRKSQPDAAPATLQSRAIFHIRYAAEDGQPQAAAGASRAPTANTWQLDFCSRPILDERGKKVWELLICDETRSFEHSRYFPNNKINSTQVRRPGAPRSCVGNLTRCASSCSMQQTDTGLISMLVLLA